MSQKSADQNISRAIDLAQRAAKAKRNGQPNLAALYEENVSRSIREARAAVRRDRIQRKPNLAFKFLAEDLGMAFGDFTQLWRASNPPLGIKSDFALAGPSKGSGS